MVYDLTRRSSWENIKNWYQDVKSYSSDCEVIIVGNKVDVADKNYKKREVNYEEAKQFADENKLLFRETSALTNYNVSEIFEELLESNFNKYIIIFLIEIYKNRNLNAYTKPKQDIIIDTLDNSTRSKSGYKCCK